MSRMSEFSTCACMLSVMSHFRISYVHIHAIFITMIHVVVLIKQSLLLYG